MSIPEPEDREPPHVLTSVCPLPDFSIQGPSRSRVHAIGLAVMSVWKPDSVKRKRTSTVKQKLDNFDFYDTLDV